MFCFFSKKARSLKTISKNLVAIKSAEPQSNPNTTQGNNEIKSLPPPQKQQAYDMARYLLIHVQIYTRLTKVQGFQPQILKQMQTGGGDK